MELTISYSPEQIILLLAKESLSLDEELKIDGHNFILRFLGLNFKGVVEKEISGDFITYTFKSKLGGAKLVLTVKENENSFSNFRADIRSWGLLGWILKNKIGQALFNLVADIEFKEKRINMMERVSYYRTIVDAKSLEELIKYLSEDKEHYHFLIINKRELIEIVYGISLVGSDVLKECETTCDIEYYKLRPLI